MTSEKEPVAYYFGRRASGIFLGLDGKGLALAAVILVIAIIVFIIIGLFGAVVVAIIGAGILWAPSPSGAPLRTLATPIIHWARSMISGTATADGTVPTAPPSQPSPWNAPYRDVQIIEHEGRAFYHRDRQYIGVWQLQSLRDFALCSIDEQEDALRRWGSTIASILAAPAVREFEWLVETLPDPGSAPASHLSQWLARQSNQPDETALADYRSLLTEVGTLAHQHRLLASVAVEPRNGKIEAASEELAAVEHRLLASGLPVRVLDKSGLAEHLAIAVDPDRVTTAAAFMALDKNTPPNIQPSWYEDLSSLDLSHCVYSSFGITELPRTAVGADWMWPLLTAIPPGLRYVVAVHMTPIAPWLAMRHAEAAVTSAESEARRRQRAGGLERARDRSVMTALLRREEEIAAGESLVRTKIVITVAGRSQTEVESAKDAVLAAARRSRLDIRTLYGAQRAGWESCLALCSPPQVETHETTTRHARSFYPAQVSAEQSGAGILVGQDALSGSPWSWDPFVLYERGMVTNPNAAVLGQVGRGKSSIVKALLARGVGVFGYRAWVLDPKGEYGPLAEALGLPLLRLQPSGTERINPLDVPSSLSQTDTAARRAQLLEALASAELNRPLEIEEIRAIDAVCHRLTSAPTLVDAANAMLEPDQELALDLASSPEAVKAAIRPAALALQHLCQGRLAGMFDGQSTISLDARGGVIDLSATYSDTAALPPIMAATMSWLTAGMAGGGGRSFLVVDEAWAVLSTGIDFLRSTAKLARSLGVSLILMMHRMSDLASAGDDSSAISKKAQGLFQDVESVFAFGQGANEAGALAAALELSDREAELLTQLGRGRCLAVVGNHHTLVDVVLTEREKQITDTDAAMRQAPDQDF
jgi:hypothetical protein